MKLSCRQFVGLKKDINIKDLESIRFDDTHNIITIFRTNHGKIQIDLGNNILTYQNKTYIGYQINEILGNQEGK